VPATRAQATLSFDWLAFAVELVTLSFDWLAFAVKLVTLSFDWLAFAVNLFAGDRTSFTANASQSNESITCARVADTEVCGCNRRRKLIFTTVEIDF